MRILCVLHKFYYGLPSMGLGNEFISFISALKNLGHEVSHFDTSDSERYPNAISVNKELLNYVLGWRPDVVLTVQKDYELWSETLDAIRAQTSAATVTWLTDDSFKFEKVSRFLAPHYDAVVTTYEDRLESYRKKDLHNVIVSQWAANSCWLRKPKRASQCKYQVSFVGMKYGDRGLMISQLQSRGISVDCFGKGWSNGAVSSDEIPEIIGDSIISLNFSAGSLGRGRFRYQIKSKIFEIPGAGGFLVTEYTPGIEKFYEVGGEVMMFRNIDELEKVLRHFLQHPAERDLIADAGFRRTQSEHTYEKRFEEILSRLSAMRQRPRTVGPAADLDEAARRFQAKSPGLALLHWTFLRVATAIWGPDRGAKAARRLLFEMSWRLLGKNTFTASGLPGRLFP